MMQCLALALLLGALLIFMAFLHRLRGGGYVKMPMKGTYVLWPLVGFAYWLAGGKWPEALAWALGYLIWCLPAWMEFLRSLVGAPVPEGQKMGEGSDVEVIWFLSDHNPLAACLIRAGAPLMPLAFGLSWLHPSWAALPLLVIIPVFPSAYAIGFRIRPLDMSSVAEHIVGASWGLAMVGNIVLGG